MENKTSSFWGFLKMDLYRSIYSLKFLASILGLVLALFAGLIDTWIFTSVLQVFESVSYGMYFLLIFIFSTFAYADCFCDDFENSCHRYALIRGNSKQYTLSKVLCIIITSILVMIIGILVFVLILRCFLPWVNTSDLYEQTYSHRKFIKLLCDNQFLFYYISRGFQIGMYAAILSLIATLASMYISNKLLVLTIPAISFYVIREILPKKYAYFFINTFLVNFNIGTSSAMNLTLSLCSTVFFSVLLYFAINYKIKRRISNE